METMSLGEWGTTFHKNYYNLSLHVAPVNESIDIIARAFSSGIPYMEDENGKLTQDDPLIDFLLKPNKHQNFKEFSKEFIRNLYASGYSYLEPSSSNTGYLRRLDKLDSEDRPELIALNTDYIDYPSNELDNFIYTSNNKQTPKDFKDMLPFWDETQDPSNYRVGISRMCSLKDEITNIILANRAKTNKIKQSGKFLATPKTSGTSTQIGMQLDQPINFKKPDYKQRDFIEDKLESTGLANGKSITVTNKEMAVMNVMESIQDYSYDNEIKEDKRTIKNTYTIPKELQNIGDDPSKYENRKEGGLELMTLTIDGLAKNFTETIQAYYQPNATKKLILDYSHHPSFEITRKIEQEKMMSQVEMLIKLNEAGKITDDEFRKKLKVYEII